MTRERWAPSEHKQKQCLPSATPALLRLARALGLEQALDELVLMKRELCQVAQKMQAGPCIPVGIQLEEAEVGSTSGPTCRISRFEGAGFGRAVSDKGRQPTS